MGRLQPALRAAEPEEHWSIWTGVPVRQVSCTIRKASMPADSWYQDPAEGGGMLFGDVCHFIDLAIWFQQSLPLEVHALRHRRSKPRRGKLDRSSCASPMAAWARCITSAEASKALSARPSISSAAADRRASPAFASSR